MCVRRKQNHFVTLKSNKFGVEPNRKVVKDKKEIEIFHPNIINAYRLVGGIENTMANCKYRIGFLERKLYTPILC